MSSTFFLAPDNLEGRTAVFVRGIADGVVEVIEAGLTAAFTMEPTVVTGAARGVMAWLACKPLPVCTGGG